MGAGKLSGHGQADAAAAGARCMVATPEPVEYPRQFLGWDTHAGVTDPHDSSVTGGPGIDRDLAASRGELQCVGEQISDDLMEPVGIGDHFNRRELAGHRDPGRLETAGQAVGSCGGDIGQISPVSCQAETGSVSLGQRLQVTNDACQPQHLISQRAELGWGGFGHPVQERFMLRLQHRDRRPKLMGDVGDKVAAQLFLAVQGIGHLVERGRKLAQFTGRPHRSHP